MKTRLTEMLHIEHPVMLAGMGGVAYSALVAAVSNAGGYGCLGASTMSARTPGPRDRRDESTHDQAIRRRPLDGLSRDAATQRRTPHRGRREHVRGRPWRARARHRPLSRPRRAGDIDVRQGRTRQTRARRRVRPRGRPRHRGRRSHRHRGDVAPRAADRRRHGRRHPGRRGRRDLRRPRARGGALAGRGRRVDRHALHRHPRGARHSRVPRIDPRESRRRHRRLARVQRQDHARTTQRDDRSLRRRSVAAEEVPGPVGRRVPRRNLPPRRRRAHARASIRVERVIRPDRPSGPSRAVVPAGDIVRSIVDEAAAGDRRDSALCSRLRRT